MCDKAKCERENCKRKFGFESVLFHFANVFRKRRMDGKTLDLILAYAKRIHSDIYLVKCENGRECKL